MGKKQPGHPIIQKYGSLLMIISGSLLLPYMITVESEPGMVPLILLLAGIGGYFKIGKRLKKITH
ncbi:MAG: hypothetical protein ACQETE_09695 [Bacteroidota bacterium]